MSWYSVSQTGLVGRMNPLRDKLAAAAQEAYDQWSQDENGEDPTLGGGGICQDIAEAMAGVISSAGIDCNTLEAQVGDQHVWAMAWDENEGLHVDISPYKYERGSGYSWKKVPGVVFSGDDIEIYPADTNVVDAAREGRLD